ncbi:RGG repeats nuclear RNA binding protein A-like [Musa acuminata AAA Group]|uniref:RGG repeats nuclear RNA binding protein A-like n=1 Tax=Musa acuminata AAA Group TaxID=214697 RepID=UPI0031DE6086
MASINPFDLLGDDDSEDPTQLIAAHQQKIASKKPTAPAAAAPHAPAKLPTKPLPPAQAVREVRDARSNTGAVRGGAGRGGPVRGRGGRGGPMSQNRDFGNGNTGGASRVYESADGAGGGEDGDAGRLQERDRPPRQPFSGGRRGGYGGRGGYRNGEAVDDSERPPRRMYDRRSGTGRGYEMKRSGAGRGNWGAATDDDIAQEKEEVLNADDKTIATEKQAEQDEVPSPEVNKDNEGAPNEGEEKEEDKEMTLEEYEKVREEKRKALLAMKNEERKVEIDEELQSMKQLSVKKGNDDVFVKLGSDKDIGKKKENIDRDERSKKSMSINEFLKPTEGERNRGGRGRGRGRGGRGQFGSGFGGEGSTFAAAAAPSIEDPGQFPTLGGK